MTPAIGGDPRLAALEVKLALEQQRLRMVQTQVALLADLDARRKQTARLFDALAALQSEIGQGLALREVRFSGEAVLDGVLVGAAARTRLAPALDKAGFQDVQVRVSPLGECHAFSVTARPPAGDPEWRFGQNLFDLGTDAVCRPEPGPPAAQVVARGSASAEAGGLTFRLRDVGVADVFRVLGELTPRGFIVDADVNGRVSVDLQGATLDQALAAMRSAGVVVGPGPLSRVSRSGKALPTRETGRKPGGTPVSLSFTRGVLADVLLLFRQISGRQVWTPPVVDGEVTIFCRDTPWDLALEAIAASAGWVSVVEDDRLFVGPAAMAKTAGWSGAVEIAKAKSTAQRATSSWARFTRIDRIAVADLKVVGVARVGTAWKAFAHGPSRLLWTLEPGLQLFDGRVHSVGPQVVTFETADGRRVEVPLGR